MFEPNIQIVACTIPSINIKSTRDLMLIQIIKILNNIKKNLHGFQLSDY